MILPSGWIAIELTKPFAFGSKAVSSTPFALSRAMRLRVWLLTVLKSPPMTTFPSPGMATERTRVRTTGLAKVVSARTVRIQSSHAAAIYTGNLGEIASDDDLAILLDDNGTDLFGGTRIESRVSEPSALRRARLLRVCPPTVKKCRR